MKLLLISACYEQKNFDLAQHFLPHTPTTIPLINTIKFADAKA